MDEQEFLSVFGLTYKEVEAIQQARRNDYESFVSKMAELTSKNKKTVSQKMLWKSELLRRKKMLIELGYEEEIKNL